MSLEKGIDEFDLGILLSLKLEKIKVLAVAFATTQDINIKRQLFIENKNAFFICFILHLMSHLYERANIQEIEETKGGGTLSSRFLKITLFIMLALKYSNMIDFAITNIIKFADISSSYDNDIHGKPFKIALPKNVIHDKGLVSDFFTILKEYTDIWNQSIETIVPSDTLRGSTIQKDHKERLKMVLLPMNFDPNKVILQFPKDQVFISVIQNSLPTIASRREFVDKYIDGKSMLETIEKLALMTSLLALNEKLAQSVDVSVLVSSIKSAGQSVGTYLIQNTPTFVNIGITATNIALDHPKKVAALYGTAYAAVPYLVDPAVNKINSASRKITDERQQTIDLFDNAIKTMTRTENLELFKYLHSVWNKLEDLENFLVRPHRLRGTYENRLKDFVNDIKKIKDQAETEEDKRKLVAWRLSTKEVTETIRSWMIAPVAWLFTYKNGGIIALLAVVWLFKNKKISKTESNQSRSSRPRTPTTPLRLRISNTPRPRSSNTPRPRTPLRITEHGGRRKNKTRKIKGGGSCVDIHCNDIDTYTVSAYCNQGGVNISDNNNYIDFKYNGKMSLGGFLNTLLYYSGDSRYLLSENIAKTNKEFINEMDEMKKTLPPDEFKRKVLNTYHKINNEYIEYIKMGMCNR